MRGRSRHPPDPGNHPIEWENYVQQETLGEVTSAEANKDIDRLLLLDTFYYGQAIAIDPGLPGPPPSMPNPPATASFQHSSSEPYMPKAILPPIRLAQRSRNDVFEKYWDVVRELHLQILNLVDIIRLQRKKRRQMIQQMETNLTSLLISPKVQESPTKGQSTKTPGKVPSRSRSPAPFSPKT